MNTPYIRTYTGKKFHPFDPQPEEIEIGDIAAGLSKQCRFAGQCPIFYSIAEHSCYVAENCSDKVKLAALLHDASEAYLVDIPKPIKQELPDYQHIERRVQAAIYRRFNINVTYAMALEIGKIDTQLLCVEFKQFFPSHYEEDVSFLAQLPLPQVTNEGRTPYIAEERFLRLFEAYV